MFSPYKLTISTFVLIPALLLSNNLFAQSIEGYDEVLQQQVETGSQQEQWLQEAEAGRHNSSIETLTDIYRLAVESDPSLQAASAKLRSDKELKNIARAKLLPQIGIEYSTTDIKQEGGFSTTKADYNQEGWQLALQQSLFDLNKWYQFKSSGHLSNKAQADFANSQQTLIEQVIKSYLNVLRTYENLSSSLAEEASIKQQLEQSQQRYDVGLVAIADVHESQAAYDTAKVSLIANMGALNIAYESLGILTGRTHQKVALFSNDLPITPPQPNDINSWVNAAKEKNIQLQAAEDAVTTSKYNYKAAASSHLPTVTATISKNEYDVTPYSGIAVNDPTITNQSLSLKVQMPIFSGGGVSANRRKAFADYDQAKQTMNGLERSIVQQTRAQYISLITQIQQVAARKQSIVSAQSAFEAIQAGYDVGTRNVLDVLNVQRSLYLAKRNYATAKFDYIESWVALKKAAGLLNPNDITAIDQWLMQDNPATLEQARKVLEKE